jgi:transcription elongation factor GreA
MEVTTMEKVPMTADGYNALIDEVKILKTVERPRIIRAIEEARAHGDLSENAEYHAAKEAQGWNEARVAELEDKISRAEVIDVSKLSGDTVKFGAKVTLIDEDTEAKVMYQIVGRLRGRCEEGPHLDLVSHCARHHRQTQRRQRGSGYPRRWQVLRNRQGGLGLTSPGCSLLRCNRAGMLTYIKAHVPPPDA